MNLPVGSSVRIREVMTDVQAVAPTACAVLVQGETGTGKEVIARAIHAASPRCHGPFVALNCAALPSSLFESELFGHARGAFTGAITQTNGRILAADGGTLFLDEIGDMPLESQPKLLRVLQERTFERLGSTSSIRTNARIIAATNQDLMTMVEKGRFRADLFYRLNVFPIALPPLRDRREDIEELASFFLKRFAADHGKRTMTMSETLVRALRGYDWPGNVRELQNFIERAVIVSDGIALTPRPSEIRRLTPASGSHEFGALGSLERQHIISTLDDTGWRLGGRQGAAARLGIPRTTLISKMQRLRIGKPPAIYDQKIQMDIDPGAVGAAPAHLY